MASVDVEGLREVVRGLERLGVDLAELKGVMHEVGDLVAVDARELIHNRTGTLAGTVRAGTAKAKATVRAGGARARYAGVNNYSPHIAGGPRRWLERAGEQNVTRIGDTLERGIRQLARAAGLTTTT